MDYEKEYGSFTNEKNIQDAFYRESKKLLCSAGVKSGFKKLSTAMVHQRKSSQADTELGERLLMAFRAAGLTDSEMKSVYEHELFTQILVLNETTLRNPFYNIPSKRLEELGRDNYLKFLFKTPAFTSAADRLVIPGSAVVFGPPALSGHPFLLNDIAAAAASGRSTTPSGHPLLNDMAAAAAASEQSHGSHL